jgi:large subunit ribosomal protein L27e
LIVLKPGKVALITRGRYAGRKAVILKPFDDGTKSHPYGHALVAGIQRYPGKITSRMGKKRIAKRSKVKPFLKAINYNHLMPTRYALEGIEQLKTQIGNENLKEVSQREEAKKAVKKSFEEKFQVCTLWFLGGLLIWCSRERISGSSRLFGSRCACCGTAFVWEFI